MENLNELELKVIKNEAKWKILIDNNKIKIQKLHDWTNTVGNKEVYKVFFFLTVNIPVLIQEHFCRGNQ